MKLRSSAFLGGRSAPVFFLFYLCLAFLLDVRSVTAQTTQPYLFAGTYDASTGTTGFVTLLRDTTTGVLTMPPNTAVSFKDPCNPSTIDPTGQFLLGVCNQGVAMFTLDSTTGIVAETPTSPYIASETTGENGVLVVAESTGQYVYLLKVSSAQPPQLSTFTLDTFSIDASAPALVAVSTQSLSLNGAWVASAADPNQHGMLILVNQGESGSSPAAVLFSISFDPSTGLANIPTAGLTIGNNARCLAMSPSGIYFALGWGDTSGSLTVYQLSTTNFNQALIGSVNLGPEDGTYGSYSFPDSIYFSPGGNLLYVQAPPASFAGDGASLPFLVFDPSNVTQLSTAPIQIPGATFLNGVADPQAPFTYVGNPGPTTYGISVFEVDLSTGLPSQTAAISSPFFPQMDLTPLFVTLTQGGQGIQGPTLGIAPAALTFGPTTVGQTSSPQNILLTSLGSESTSLSSISISGANASDFIESDTCMSSPVLPTNHTCTIAITYAPGGVGTSQATLVITDNAAGSPQSIPLSGTSVAAPPPAPAVTLNPSTSLNFSGSATQGTSTSPQNVTVTNSGNAPLQFISAVLSGFNSGDFSISSDTCSGSLSANASCTISIVFTPQAAGIRTTTLTITDNAASSPQSLTINGTAVAAVTIVTASGSSATASLSAGQTAQFNLEATPGAGFNGTLAFTCSGAPFAAICTVPSSVSVSNGTAASFAISISTSGSSQFPPYFRFPSSSSRPDAPPLAFALLAMLCTLLICVSFRPAFTRLSRPLTATAATAFSLLLLFSGIGCGGAVSTQTSLTTPTTATPSIQPAGGTFTSAQNVSISDNTAGATIYYTTDGSTPTSASPVYSGSFSLSSPTTIQAMAAASGYNNSAITSAAFQFQTPSATYPITVTVTATPAGSTKALQLNPILLTLIVK